MDMRVNTLPLTLGGETYELRCNFAVLADVDFSYGGVKKALNAGSFFCALTFMTAMVNDSLRRRGSDKRYTTEEVSALVDGGYNGSAVDLANAVNGLVFSAVLGDLPAADNSDDNTAPAEGGTSKN